MNAGTGTSPSADVAWTKTYVGVHEVFYCGFRESKGIWGTWEILSDARDGLEVAAIVTWNTLYLEHAVAAFARRRTKKSAGLEIVRVQGVSG